MANEKVQELYERLEKGVAEIYTSDMWKDFLNVQSKFHRYSFNNTILIWLQMPTASRVAGFHTWKNLGRHVSKGAKAIKIFAPLIGKKKEQDDEGKEVDKSTLYGFKIVNVFDVSQTEGKELPEFVDELDGNSEAAAQMLTALEEVITIPVIYKEIKDPDLKGYYSPEPDEITIKENMSKDQTVKTLIHEYIHHLLHHKASDRADKSRGQREAEAEGTAYVVASYFGLDTNEYSFGYVAGWVHDEQGIEMVKHVGATIQKTAQEVIDRIDKTMKKKLAKGA